MESGFVISFFQQNIIGVSLLVKTIFSTEGEILEYVQLFKIYCHLIIMTNQNCKKVYEMLLKSQ